MQVTLYDPYMSASEVVFHEEALYQVYLPLPLPLLLMYHVIPRMRNANFVNRYGDFGTTSISMERFNMEISNLVGIFIITSICQHMTIYPLKWAWSGSRDLNLKFGTPSITFERLKLRTPNFVG